MHYEIVSFNDISAKKRNISICFHSYVKYELGSQMLSAEFPDDLNYSFLRD